MTRRCVALLAAALILQPAWALKSRKRARRQVRTPAPVMTVVAGPDIEQKVFEESDRAEDILCDLRRENALDSPFLVSAVYYHDGLFDRFRLDRPDADPGNRIVAYIDRLLTPERKRSYIDLLRQMSPGASKTFALPARYSEPAGRRGRRRWRQRNHKNAVDIFVPEGSPVYSACAGIVLLAESGWDPDEPLSTSSRRGGNAVIVFDGASRFYRYCHLDQVAVKPGAIVETGGQIGSVGHTGFNASRPGHGGHLHFEINEYDGRTVRALDDKQLRAWLHKVAAR